MRFRIERTSGYSAQPCDDAVLMGQDVCGNIWDIEVRDLEHLIEVWGQTGEQLIIKRHAETGEPALEIYDDYRE